MGVNVILRSAWRGSSAIWPCGFNLSSIAVAQAPADFDVASQAMGAGGVFTLCQKALMFDAAYVCGRKSGRGMITAIAVAASEDTMLTIPHVGSSRE